MLSFQLPGSSYRVPVTSYQLPGSSYRAKFSERLGIGEYAGIKGLATGNWEPVTCTKHNSP